MRHDTPELDVLETATPLPEEAPLSLFGYATRDRRYRTFGKAGLVRAMHSTRGKRARRVQHDNGRKALPCRRVLRVAMQTWEAQEGGIPLDARLRGKGR